MFLTETPPPELTTAIAGRCDMAWPTPKFTKGEINKAGQILADYGNMDGEATVTYAGPSFNEVVWAHEVLGNWRACHGYPINTFQMTLRSKVSRLDYKVIVAQRLKRASSIVEKLRRFKDMRLARMQDLGGVRAILPTVKDVRDLVENYKQSKFRHTLANEKDYITTPAKSGYRSVHLVYKYCSPAAPAYDGLSVELQIRTKTQHAWATAVETVGTFLGQALKSQRGQHEWLRFFELTGSAFAHLEKTPPVPGYGDLSRAETFLRVQEMERDLGVIEKLRGFIVVADEITKQRKGRYHLITLDTIAHTVSLKAYGEHDLNQATTDYAHAEAIAKGSKSTEVVLVSAGPINQLKKAYPNYFADTRDFVTKINAIIHEVSRKVVVPITGTAMGGSIATGAS